MNSDLVAGDLAALQKFLDLPDCGRWDSCRLEAKAHEPITGAKAVRELLDRPDLGAGWLQLTDRVLYRGGDRRWHALTPGAAPDPEAAMPLSAEFAVGTHGGLSLWHEQGETWRVAELCETSGEADHLVHDWRVETVLVGWRLSYKVYWQAPDTPTGRWRPAGRRLVEFQSVEARE